MRDATASPDHDVTMAPGYASLANRFKHSATQAYVLATLALAISVYSQLPALANRYVFNDDFGIHLYWMQQFRDGDLFRDDLLTRFSVSIQPWGVVGLYRFLSYFLDPLIISKVLPIVLFIVFIVYVYLLVRQIATNYAALLAASCFMIIPVFLDRMVGGHARAFAYPLIILFLFYLVKKSYKACAILLVLQALFYPTAFLLSALTYFLCLFYKQGRWISFTRNGSSVMYFVMAVMAGGCIISTKHLLGSDPSIGNVLVKSQMIGRTEFYSGGRFEILPIPPMLDVAKSLTLEPVLNIAAQYPEKVRELLPEILNMRSVALLIKGFFILIALYLIWEIISGRLFIPMELAALVASGLILYKLADIFLFKLYLPDRYLQYTLPVAMLIFVCIGINQLLMHLGNGKTVIAMKGLVLFAVLSHFTILKGVGLSDHSHNKTLYEYLERLPKNSLIAAHPDLADYIPTFSKRKVFINGELSQPWMDRYWDVIKGRTLDFFDAYYADSCAAVEAFSKKHSIDYLVVDRRNFTKEFLQGKRIYFEPFHSFVRKMTQERNNYTLLNIPEEYKLFSNGDKSVVDVNAFKCDASLPVAGALNS